MKKSASAFLLFLSAATVFAADYERTSGNIHVMWVGATSGLPSVLEDLTGEAAKFDGVVTEYKLRVTNKSKAEIVIQDPGGEKVTPRATMTLDDGPPRPLFKTADPPYKVAPGKSVTVLIRFPQPPDEAKKMLLEIDAGLLGGKKGDKLQWRLKNTPAGFM